jgi:hypothetical protein
LCTVSTVGPTTAFGYEVEFKREACSLLANVLSNKARKLAHLSFPLVLLVLNEYAIIESWHYKECIPDLTALRHFHTVFIVDDEARGYVLCTKNDGW